MSNRLQITNARTLTSGLARLGIDPPAEVTEAAERVDRIVTGYRNRPPHDVLRATMAALDAGRDPATDPAVQAAVTSQAIAAFDDAGGLHLAATDLIVAAATRHADDIVDLLRVPFDAAATELAELHTKTDGHALDDIEGAGQRSPDLAAALSRARFDVLPHIDSVVATWGALYALTTSSGHPPTKNRAIYIWCEPDPVKWIAADLDRNPPRIAWDVLPDHALELATLDEYPHRSAAVHQARHAEAAEVVAAAAEARRLPSILPPGPFPRFVGK